MLIPLTVKRPPTKLDADTKGACDVKKRAEKMTAKEIHEEASPVVTVDLRVRGADTSTETSYRTLKRQRNISNP